MNEATTMERWGHWSYRARRRILWAALGFVAFAVIWGTGVFGSLESAGGFDAPNSQSQHEAALAASAFGRDAGDVVILYSSPHAINTAANGTAITHTLEALPKKYLDSFATYWTTGRKSFLSTNGRSTFALLELRGASDDARQSNFDAIKTELAAPGLTDQIGGLVPTDELISAQTSKDIGRAESLSMPILLLLLLLIFGSLVAASLPLAIGAVGILGSLTALRLLTLVTGVSIFSVNITTILGLGLGIDYGLFMVSRFREELRRNETTEAAVARTMATAGRTVLFSGITVAVALSGLMLFPETFLRSMGYGGVFTVMIDVLAALTVMPALLSVLGPKVNSLRIRRSLSAEPPPTEGGAWYRLAKGVMRRPILVAGVIIVVLVALGSPFLKAAWGGTDATVLPTATAPHQVQTALATGFPGNPAAPIESILQFQHPLSNSSREMSELRAYDATLRHLPGITGAAITGIKGDLARIDLSYRPSPYSRATQVLVARAANVAAPAGATRFIGGETAELTDTLSSLGSVLPWMGLIVVLATFVLLFLAFGSIVLPVKAIVMNILSLSVMFGVLVWVFQEGHLSGILAFSSDGTINPATPILMFAIMFGLSMDYEVFLLSRIREHYLATGNNEAAIATGLQKTGGVITGAALMLGVVIGAFSLSNVTLTKMMGVGMVVALIVDATIVRLLLVPSTMKLLGRANWWAPAPLRRLHDRLGFSEGSDSTELYAPEEELVLLG